MSSWALRPSRCRFRSWLCHCGLRVLGRMASPPRLCLLAAVQGHRAAEGPWRWAVAPWPLGCGSTL